MKKKERLHVKIKRLINKNEWVTRLLSLPVSDIPPDRPGLIMIQIDGFSRKQLERAIKQKEMPFLSKLIYDENYQLYSHYPGLPAATPSVQGELFYGVKQSIPAFSFYHTSARKIYTMFNGDDCAAIEKELSRGREGLLKGGSSYADVFSGGAAECHFSPVNLRLFRMLKNVKLFKRILFFVLYSFKILTIIILMLWETLIALGDFITGFRFDKNIRKELKFIPTRALFCILLRELILIGVKLDITRGFPIIHANFMGYDEQAHRRGPSSKFAHWALKGIDGAIKRIYGEALKTSKRHYDVWIYSDHGQEDICSYTVNYGYSLQHMVEKIFKDLQPEFVQHTQTGITDQRLRYFHNPLINRLFLKYSNTPGNPENKKWIVTAIGPTANIYAPVSLSFEDKSLFAQKLVTEGHIPLVAVNEKHNERVHVWTERGKFVLPDDGPRVFTYKHPFLPDIIEDFIRLTQHEHAGDFTISGWRPYKKPISFPVENGAHAGIGYEETHAFALLPSDVFSLDDDQTYIKTKELRESALRYLNQEGQIQQKFHINVPRKAHIRVMTYNVHSCIGLDGHLSPDRIARVIARYKPDIVALQELDMHKIRTDKVDQPYLIAESLQMHYHFHPSISIKEEKYGNAILSRFPIESVRVGKLPNVNRFNAEDRGAIWTRVNINGIPWQIINTHLGLTKAERLIQAESLLGIEWLGDPQCHGPTILCGDFNALPYSEVCKKIQATLTNSNLRHKVHTWMSRCLVGQLDHIFVSPNIKVLDLKTPSTDLDKVASDHLPLIADLEIPKG
jgi:endonuclease/exonuclease/phosphatase family metal-dependent hydrolase